MSPDPDLHTTLTPTGLAVIALSLLAAIFVAIMLVLPVDDSPRRKR